MLFIDIIGGKRWSFLSFSIVVFSLGIIFKKRKMQMNQERKGNVRVMRLDKYLADMSFGTRKEVKLLIRQKRVQINGEIATSPEYKLNENSDKVVVDGKEVVYQKFIYYMLNKPAGYVSATRDDINPTVMELIDGRPGKNVFPMGRLDKDTEGLLILTNDGKLASSLLLPGHHVEKTYYVQVEGALDEDDVRSFQEGMDIGDEKPAKPAKLEIIKSDARSEAMVVITEGRYHQVKRMFAKRRKPVLYLKRIAIGGLKLDDSLKPGEVRALTADEVMMLKAKN